MNTQHRSMLERSPANQAELSLVVQVAMESPGVYWKTVWNALENTFR